ncbi:CHAT domain-containing protein, partial [Cellvibrio sp.]
KITEGTLRAGLVLLGACETAQGKLVGGEGSMGLSRGFFEAGAKRVVASFWPVEDKSTAYFMEQFYHSLLTNNKGPLQALQEAQQAVSRVPRWSHPYYWASMAYFGNREAWRE